MKFLFLLIPAFIFGLDFEFVVENIYRLKSDEFSIKDGYLSVSPTFDRSKKQLNKSIKTQDSKLVLDKNLRYYYHTNKFIDFEEDLIELKLSGDSYRAKIKKQDSKDCFIIIKYTEQKTLKTKSNAMVLDLNTLDFSDNSKIYFTCLQNNKYIY